MDPHHRGCCFYNQRNWTDYNYRWQVRTLVYGKIVMMNCGMTARFPRTDHLTLTSLWRQFPGYLLLVLLPAVILLFPKLCTPAMPNTPFQPHWNKKDCDQVQLFVLKSTCSVTCIVRRDPVKAPTVSGFFFHWVSVFTGVDSSPSKWLS